jgi:hypothetical protein
MMWTNATLLIGGLTRLVSDLSYGSRLVTFVLTGLICGISVVVLLLFLRILFRLITRNNQPTHTSMKE